MVLATKTATLEDTMIRKTAVEITEALRNPHTVYTYQYGEQTVTEVSHRTTRTQVVVTFSDGRTSRYTKGMKVWTAPELTAAARKAATEQEYYDQQETLRDRAAWYDQN